MSDNGKVQSAEEFNILNIAYDLLANNPIAGAYNMEGFERDYIKNMVDHVDEETSTIHLVSPETGRHYSLHLVADFAPRARIA